MNRKLGTYKVSHTTNLPRRIIHDKQKIIFISIISDYLITFVIIPFNEETF